MVQLVAVGAAAARVVAAFVQEFGAQVAGGGGDGGRGGVGGGVVGLGFDEGVDFFAGGVVGYCVDAVGLAFGDGEGQDWRGQEEELVETHAESWGGGVGWDGV